PPTISWAIHSWSCGTPRRWRPRASTRRHCGSTGSASPRTWTQTGSLSRTDRIAGGEGLRATCKRRARVQPVIESRSMGGAAGRTAYGEQQRQGGHMEMPGHSSAGAASILALVVVAVAAHASSPIPLEHFADEPAIMAPALSPDGSKLAFIRVADGKRFMALFDLKTRDLKILASGET